MSGIKDQIGPMLSAIADERKKLEERLQKLQEREVMLRAWAAEDKSAQQQLPLLIEPQAMPPKTLSDFFRIVLADGRSRTTADLAELAERQGLIGEAKSARRAANFALLSMKNAGRVVVRNGQWSINRER